MTSFAGLVQLQKYYKRGGAIKTWGIRNEIITLQKEELRPMNDFGSRRKNEKNNVHAEVSKVHD